MEVTYFQKSVCLMLLGLLENAGIWGGIVIHYMPTLDYHINTLFACLEGLHGSNIFSKVSMSPDNKSLLYSFHE